MQNLVKNGRITKNQRSQKNGYLKNRQNRKKAGLIAKEYAKTCQKSGKNQAVQKTGKEVEKKGQNAAKRGRENKNYR